MKFKIFNRKIEFVRENGESYIGDNADYEAVFEFDDEWSGIIKTARFIQYGKHIDVILENDKCIIPVEVLKKGYIKIGVFSVEMTTTFCEVFIKESIKESSGSAIEPTPDVYAQIIAMIENIEVQGVTDEQIEKAVAKYMEEHPIKLLTEEDVQRIVSEYVTAHKEEFKGDKGEKGEKGDKGDTGADGYTPVKGTDYWTAEDITEIQSYIDTQIGGALNGSY